MDNNKRSLAEQISEVCSCTHAPATAIDAHHRCDTYTYTLASSFQLLLPFLSDIVKRLAIGKISIILMKLRRGAPSGIIDQH